MRQALWFTLSAVTAVVACNLLLRLSLGIACLFVGGYIALALILEGLKRWFVGPYVEGLENSEDLLRGNMRWDAWILAIFIAVGTAAAFWAAVHVANQF